VAKITLRLPTLEVINQLGNDLRPCDSAELTAVTDLSPLQAVQASVRNSHPDFLWAYYADDVLLCIAGCTLAGNPWLLATPALDNHLHHVTGEAKRQVRMMLQHWGKLSNIIDIRNSKAIRWLKALGFEFTETLEIKPGLPVIQFEKVCHERAIQNSAGVHRL
jgi:hypothetical protein